LHKGLTKGEQHESKQAQSSNPTGDLWKLYNHIRQLEDGIADTQMTQSPHNVGATLAVAHVQRRLQNPPLV